MKGDDKRVIMASVDALMEELKQVVSIARETVDDVWLLSYITAELRYVFRKEGDDVQMSQLWGDVRLP